MGRGDAGPRRRGASQPCRKAVATGPVPRETPAAVSWALPLLGAGGLSALSSFSGAGGRKLWFLLFRFLRGSS